MILYFYFVPDREASRYCRCVTTINISLSGGGWREKKELEAKSLWRGEVQERSDCSSGNLGALDCKEAGR